MGATLGIKIDARLERRINQAAQKVNRTSQWLVKQAVYSYLEKLETNQPLPELSHLLEGEDLFIVPTDEYQPFLNFAYSVAPQTVLRAAITAAYRRPEEECIGALLERAKVTDAQEVTKLARSLVEKLRQKDKSKGVEALVQEFSLSSQEGVALMCLAEALLRIPDAATRDALIRDKISHGNWQAHLGNSRSMFVNAATWGLVVTGKLVSTNSESGLSASLTRIISKGGEPLIRKAVDMAMRLMGEQFVTGENISEALANSKKYVAQGFTYSYDMLGEAAATQEDALRYLAAYEQAIHAIGNASKQKGVYQEPGISIKLSALHPRYSRAQQDRVFAELYPRVLNLCLLAQQYDIGINIDAEEADRLELSLDLLERLCFEPALARWNGIGFVIQAYQKRAPYVIEYVIDLARRSQHRLMVRLVKGAYWDTEIKRAQVDGLEGYPVYTRKQHTDIAYLACARMLLAAPELVYPQFATHNAFTLAAIYYMAKPETYHIGQYEFQCLHGMGEALYQEVTTSDLARPCRVYAPVGTHETLLAYLVRRLLENGANTSFVHQIADKSVPVDDLIEDPITYLSRKGVLGTPHSQIPLPRNIYPSNNRLNSSGFDLSNEQRLASLSAGLLGGAQQTYQVTPILAGSNTEESNRDVVTITNPAHHLDVLGHVEYATISDVTLALTLADEQRATWQSMSVQGRADCLFRAADQLENRLPYFIGLIVREAGKSIPNAVGEVREAIDFLRYYADQIVTTFDNETHRPLGTVVCISPWNFPLAIFMGQISAALAAGNVVIAKPAEQTNLIAFEAVRLLHEAGVPVSALQLLPGLGETVGATLVADQRVQGVVFTGSTEVAKHIARTLADRVDAKGRSIPLIAETGGQNAMIVDSSALPEQVVHDVLQSAFDSAGQRCSALRVLCLQEEVAEPILHMLKGAMFELQVGIPDHLATDVGPVIDLEAKQRIEQHIQSMREQGCPITQTPLSPECDQGTFISPTIIEIESIKQLTAEVFAPVLHVLRYKRSDLKQLMAAIQSTGYGLTFGLHSRIDEVIQQIATEMRVGNIYVNRNIIGATVGVQPFGGEGLSGTGPKAGGPLYLLRLLTKAPQSVDTIQSLTVHKEDLEAQEFRLKTLRTWLDSQPKFSTEPCYPILKTTLGLKEFVLAGPTGEQNIYKLVAKGTVLCQASTVEGLSLQACSAWVTGNQVLCVRSNIVEQWQKSLPPELTSKLQVVATLDEAHGLYQTVLYEGDADNFREFQSMVTSASPHIVMMQSLSTHAISSGETYRLECLLVERVLTINTTASGGNANLMTMELE